MQGLAAGSALLTVLLVLLLLVSSFSAQPPPEVLRCLTCAESPCGLTQQVCAGCALPRGGTDLNCCRKVVLTYEPCVVENCCEECRAAYLDLGLIISEQDCKCADLFKQIKERRDELAKRVDQLRRNAGDLPPTKPDKPDPRYGYRSIAGEIQQFENKQANLRTLLLDHQRAGCKQNTEDAWKYATREVPSEIPGETDMTHVEAIALVLEVSVGVLLWVFAAPEVIAAGVFGVLLSKIAA